MDQVLINLFYAALDWTRSGAFIQQFIGFAFIFFICVVTFRAVNGMREARRRNRVQRHERMFNQQQKHEGHRRAGGRCEFSVGLHRCNRASVHADHFYPYGRGGATSMQNFVAACEFHNLSKGMKMPSSLEKSRIEARRKRYFPILTSEKVGEWA